MSSLDSGRDSRSVKQRSILGKSGLGSPDSAISQLFRGYDHRQTGTNFQRDAFNHGYVFYTRPMMNMSYDNINGDPLLSCLLSDDLNSPFRYVRAMLDPQGEYDSNLIDREQPFIPILTNTCVSHSGWPDIGIDSYVAPEGMRREAWAMGESVAEFNGVSDLSASFENTHGNILLFMFHCWIKYIGEVKMGDDMTPYPQAWMTHYLDYVSRCWRIVLDKNKRYVTGIATSVASYPENAPLGAQFNFNKDSVFPQDTSQINIQWKSMCIEYNYEHLIDEFNENVCFKCPKMRDHRRPKEMVLLKLTSIINTDGSPMFLDELNLTNFDNLYPRINPETKEFEWWMKLNEYKTMRNLYELD